jgi:uncharacterized membrane protein YhiD involved in acid resistance
MAVIGLALGARHYSLASILYFITMGSLWLLRYLEPILPRETFRQISLHMRAPGMSIEEARKYFQGYRLVLQSVNIAHNKHADSIAYIFFLHGKRQDAFVEAFGELLKREDVHYGKLLQQGGEEERSS